MHFCMDEVYAIMMLVPGVGLLVGWIRAKLHHRREHADCKKG